LCSPHFEAALGEFQMPQPIPSKIIAVALFCATAMVHPAIANEIVFTFGGDGTSLHAKGGGGNGGGKPDKPGGDNGDGGSSVRDPLYFSWMHGDIQGAWDSGYLGQNATITVVDDFNSRSKYFGNLGDGLGRSRHGEWTLQQAGMIAPSATMVADDFTSGGAVSLGNGFNVINASYGWVEVAGTFAGFDAQEQSIVDYATDGSAFISKSAGNDAIAIGEVIQSGIYAGHVDYLGANLVGTQSAVFVGALESNGSTSSPASLAYYSNYAGSDATVQSQFLVVGVEDGLTGLAGTSFAAPIVSGYAAVLSSKFTGATATQIANQLLDTARTDTIFGYDVSIHGQGESSISRALAPASIN
jgi:subtilisin family serine protease